MHWEIFRTVYRTLMALVTLGFLAAAFLAYWHSTPANGMLLVAGLLFVIAILTGLSISTHDDRHRRILAERETLDRACSLFSGNLRFGKAIRGQPAGLHFETAEPEVHSMDMAAVDEAKRMAADGASLDDICRYVDPGFDGRDMLYREAFRRMVQTMIDHG